MHLRRHTSRPFRRTTALALGGLVLASPMLTSCGFDYATDRVNTVANGVNQRDASVDVLGAVIVSAQDNSGTFIATFSNNSQSRKNSVDSLAGADGNTIQAESFSPIDLAPGGMVNLAQQGGIPVSGTFKAGDFVPVTVTFGSGERVSLKVLVVTDTGQYAGLDQSGSGSGASQSPSSSETSASPSGAAEPAGSPSETTSASPTASPTE